MTELTLFITLVILVKVSCLLSDNKKSRIRLLNGLKTEQLLSSIKPINTFINLSVYGKILRLSVNVSLVIFLYNKIPFKHRFSSTTPKVIPS